MIRCVTLVLYATLFTALAASARGSSSLTLSSDDTEIRVAASADGRLVVAALRCRQTGRQWIPAHDPAAIPLIAAAGASGRDVQLNWRLASVRSDTQLGVARRIFTFKCRSPKLELVSEWRARRGPGPIEHTISITNLGDQPVELPLQTSLVFESEAPGDRAIEQWWVEKGAGGPSAAGTHHEALGPGPSDRSLYSSPYSEDNESRDSIPWMAVQDTGGRQGWYTGIEFSGRVRQRLSVSRSPNGHAYAMRADLGLSPEPPGQAPYRTVLLAGETFRTPTVFVGCYAGNVDDGSNRLRRWVEAALRPPVHIANYPLLTLNSWGSGMAVDETLAGRMIDDGAALGLEMYHVDAGWFRDVGDWRPSLTKFPHGLTAVVDRAHARGLKFGLWVGWTQGGVQPDTGDRQIVLNVFAPDRRSWFTHDYPSTWKPADFVGADLCLSDPAADSWCLSMLDRLVGEYKLDMLEHDQRMIVDSCDRADHAHTGSHTDIASRAANGYYSVYDRLRARHPNLLFEDCVNGGRMVDYGVVRRVHYISITDSYNPLANRRAFYDASYALPPSMCECYVENTPVNTSAQFRTMLRSGMMGWCTIMCDTNRWTEEQHAIARRQFVLYKSVLRALIQTGNLYHLTSRPDGRRWDGIQYASPDGERAVIYAFRGTDGKAAHVFTPRGLSPDSMYTVTVEDAGTPPVITTGRAIMEAGLTVPISEPGGSEIVQMVRQRRK